MTKIQNQKTHTQALVSFSPIDSWFFRESRPHGSVGVNALNSVFPPPTRTLMGALRSHIGNHYFQLKKKNDPADNRTWQDLERITELNQVIGTATRLGSLQPRGIFLRQQQENKAIDFFPAPINICQKTISRESRDTNKQPTHSNHYFALELSEEVYETDVGRVKLPILPNKVSGLDELKGAKPLENMWLSKQAWTDVLAGNPNKMNHKKEIEPSNTIKANADFIHDEYRLGIQVNSKQRSVVEGQLYQTTHIRLDNDSRICMPIDYDGKQLQNIVGADFLTGSSLLRLGGEGRMANIEFSQVANDYLPSAPKNLTITVTNHAGNKKKRFMIYLLTKLPMQNGQTNDWLPQGFQSSDAGSGWQGSIRGFDIHILSACIAKAHREGGWDQLQHKPRAISNYIPAGSAFFVEVDESIDDKQLIGGLHGQTLYEQDSWGQGIMLLGRYIQNQ